MRGEFVESVTSLTVDDPKSVFITGDLGFMAFESLRAKLEERFLNAGIAEQNMVGIAAGMALRGLKPWVYSIAPFIVYRCLEQIRNDICFHRLPVKLVGNGGGFSYGIMGPTHHALEDLAVLKSFPNLSLFFPASVDQVEITVSRMGHLNAPSYLRLANSPYSVSLKPLYENPETLTRHYQQGSLVTAIGVGSAAQIILNALMNNPSKLSGVDIFSISRFPFQPEIDSKLFESVRQTRKVILVEEHVLSGSISESFIAQISNLVSHAEIMSVNSSYNAYGSQAYHLKESGLTPDAFISRAIRVRDG